MIYSVQTDKSLIPVEADEDSPEKHAYIPYLYARNCIAKIMEDMTQQKSNHIVIVENIQTHYKTIEDETQVRSIQSLKQFGNLKNCYIYPNALTVWFKHRVMHPNDADGMASSSSLI